MGLIDTPEKAADAGHDFRRADVDLIFLYVSTYALSSTVLPVVRRAKVPVIILNLSPPRPLITTHSTARRSHQNDGRMAGLLPACPVPEIANVFNRCRIPFFKSPECLKTIRLPGMRSRTGSKRRASPHIMEHNRLGVMGHYYGGMLDIYSDLTQQCAYFGGHIEILEVDELAALRRSVSDDDISEKVVQLKMKFEVQPDCSH